MLFSFLSWIDNRTILGCVIILTFTFALVFQGLRRMHPDMRGSQDFSLAYFFGLIGCLLLISRGSIPNVLSIVAGNTFLFLCFAFVYRGILNFFQKSRSLLPIWIVIALAAIPLTWFSEVHNQMVPRVITISLIYALIRGLTAYELFRNAAGKTLITLFACIMSLYALSGLNRAIFTAVFGAPQDFMQHNPLQSAMLVVEIIFVSITAIFELLMLYGELLSRIEEQSHHDTVSGALNRRGIESRLGLELKRIERGGQKLSVALIDIDYFKVINDTEGHAAGDHALRKVVSSIATQLRAYDVLGRFGGDEFLLILPQTAIRDALTVAERVGNSARILTGKGPTLTLSIGLSEAVPGERAISLLARADQALYDAKRAGRNCTRVVMPDLRIPISLQPSIHP